MSKVQSRKQKIIEYCVKSRRSSEIADHLEIAVDYVYRYIRPLVKSGVLEKLTDHSKPNNHGVRYIATGKPLCQQESAPATYNTGFTVLGVRL